MRLKRSILRHTGGATIVEFALTAPIFIALLFAIVECGIAGWTQFGLQYGVQAAARCASLQNSSCSSPSQIAQYAADNALGVTVQPSTFTVTAAACGNQIQASYAYNFFTLFFGTPTITMTAQACYLSQT